MRVAKGKADPDREFKELRDQILRAKDALDKKVECGELDEVEFATQVNNLMGEYLERASRVLSSEDFEQYFGEPYTPGAKPVLVDPEIAALNRHHRTAHS
ncbi:MAG TPA: hypothetical protein VII95_18680 [Terriglobales bacterium]